MTGEHFDVIVIGGGPAGVAAAVELKRRGVGKVVILDREPRLGGATRHCVHSPFGMLEFGRVYLGAAYGRRLEREAARHGVDVRCGCSVTDVRDNGAVAVTSRRGVAVITADRILLATGARETPRSARLLPGDRPLGIVTTGTLQSYIAFHGMLPFTRPLVIGSELVALSALLTCLMRGVRPVAMIEAEHHVLARPPFCWFLALTGIPFHTDAQIVDIIGTDRVAGVRISHQGREALIDCDGILLTGRFTPESALFREAGLGVDSGSGGPAVDQNGRAISPTFYSAGNSLRGVETGGWCFREGRSVGAAIAQDLQAPREAGEPVKVAHEEPLKLVVPSIIRPAPIVAAALGHFQIRFSRRVRGELTLVIDGDTVWRRNRLWGPERRFLVPIPPLAATAASIRFRFVDQA
jgi:NADPH-dependent 2,4-dienoyl-CoA reductase/sulfur reductase-like enzyme